MVAVLTFFVSDAFIDDALIYARYIANALHGLGLVFNPGEHINALTSPFYSYLVLGAARLAGGHVLPATAALWGLCFFLASATAELLVPFAGLLLASTGYFYSLVGMESSLFLFLLLLPLLLLQRDKMEWLPTAAVLLVLTRFEGVALLLPLAIELKRRRRWPSAKSFIPVVFLILAYLALNHAWYGAYVPDSAGAKLGQGRSGLWGRWPTAFFQTAYQLKPEFLSTIYVVAAVAILAVPGLVRLRHSALVRVGLPFLALLLGFYMVFNLPGYKWYYAPFVCFAMLFACAAIPDGGRWRWAVPLVAALSAATAVHRFSSLRYDSRALGYPGVAAWLTRNAPPGARIEAAEIGTLGWFCPRCRIIDVLGLTFPKNAAHIAHGDTRSWLAEDRPDYIVVHLQPWIFEAVAKGSGEYHRVPVDFGKIVYLLQRNSSAAPNGSSDLR